MTDFADQGPVREQAGRYAESLRDVRLGDQIRLMVLWRRQLVDVVESRSTNDLVHTRVEFEVRQNMVMEAVRWTP